MLIIRPVIKLFKYCKFLDPRITISDGVGGRDGGRSSLLKFVLVANIYNTVNNLGYGPSRREFGRNAQQNRKVYD